MVKITWLGHSAFKIEIAGKTVLVDPWLSGNPTAAVKASEITEADIVYVTHDHHDHLGDAFDICKRTGATFVAIVDLARYAEENGIKKIEGLNIGGCIEIDGVKLTVVQATHTASRGVPTGVIIQGEEKTIYHAGDTGLFGDMRLIGELCKPDLALIPIGGYYTMDAKEAVEAVKLLTPKAVVPMHYKTFPVLAKSAEEFARSVREKTPKVKVVVLNPGESYLL
ncbi:MAG TPA: metal-dependent hydrolase [Acidobacteriota bacterium]|nr:metal-dependent hydrolase [Acidobacteriota bacterium]